MFSLKCIIEDDGLLMSFSSHGSPLYDRCKENNKDIYDSEQAGIAILKGISDMCEYINRGSDGWCILISKRLDSIKILKEQDYKELEELTKLASAEKLTIERANSSHVKSIIDLMYRTYRYSYAKSAFYYEDVLSKGIEDGSILSIIAVNNKGEVV